ncbi:GNAT family N-acetyltransferase [Salsipaludibacter albus]|uniref:GNAT family N-acetyltransferase n=1 Tax=Salsipaludibacter albus TaxID=2849650 RepID=UPI001EE430AF|nr:GNAT family N-acetyltransferase [Salsipaludibacter albus]
MAEHAVDLPVDHVARPATWDDLDGVARLFQRAEADRQGTISFREQDLRLRWLGRDDFTDTVVVLDGEGDLAAFAEFTVDDGMFSDRPDVWIDARVDPHHLDKGLASWLHRQGEERARREARDRGLDTVMLRTTLTAGDRPAAAFLRARGFEPAHHYLAMRLGLHEPPSRPVWPDPVTIRSASHNDLAAIHRTHQVAFDDHPTAMPLGLTDWVESRTAGAPPDWPLWLVAEVDDRVVGICLGRSGTPEGKEVGYIRDLGVVPQWRRRGIALALLMTAFRRFYARGLSAVALEVDDDTLDGAADLYERAGMEVVRRTDVVEHVVEARPDEH